MTPIEKAEDALIDEAYATQPMREVTKATITAFLAALLADPEAMERITRDADRICLEDRECRKSPYQAAIEALKQEAER